MLFTLYAYEPVGLSQIARIVLISDQNSTRENRPVELFELFCGAALPLAVFVAILLFAWTQHVAVIVGFAAR